jgi:hypothetical protein
MGVVKHLHYGVPLRCAALITTLEMQQAHTRRLSVDTTYRKFIVMARFQIMCRGTSPLLMHNARLADPLDEVVKEIKTVSGKLRKTDADHELLGRLEFIGGMYYAEPAGPYLPAANIRKALIEAARKSKSGKLVEQGLFVDTLINPLLYDGPRDLDGLWADKNFVSRLCVKVQTARLMRTRPMFPFWAVDAVCSYDPELLNFAQIKEFAQIAGNYIGVGDYRPLYGRFIADLEEIGDDVAPAA